MSDQIILTNNLKEKFQSESSNYQSENSISGLLCGREQNIQNTTQHSADLVGRRHSVVGSVVHSININMIYFTFLRQYLHYVGNIDHHHKVGCTERVSTGIVI